VREHAVQKPTPFSNLNRAEDDEENSKLFVSLNKIGGLCDYPQSALSDQGYEGRKIYKAIKRSINA
jgi:hypothetical protein